MYIKRRIILKAFIQRTLTVGGRITVQLVSSLNRFDLPDSLHTNNNVISSFNNSLTGVQVYSDPSLKARKVDCIGVNEKNLRSILFKTEK